ncbi:MAG: hypothetical protein KBS75_05920 [Bacteroidales bacterium]|nr:hypothetical protein [Candidatus Equimonas faecalis]
MYSVQASDGKAGKASRREATKVASIGCTEQTAGKASRKEATKVACHKDDRR